MKSLGSGLPLKTPTDQNSYWKLPLFNITAIIFCFKSTLGWSFTCKTISSTKIISEWMNFDFETKDAKKIFFKSSDGEEISFPLENETFLVRRVQKDSFLCNHFSFHYNFFCTWMKERIKDNIMAFKYPNWLMLQTSFRLYHSSKQKKLLNMSLSIQNLKTLLVTFAIIVSTVSPVLSFVQLVINFIVVQDKVVTKKTKWYIVLIESWNISPPTAKKVFACCQFQVPYPLLPSNTEIKHWTDSTALYTLF